MSKNGEVSSNQGPSRPTMPKPDLNLVGPERRKVLDLQLGGPSGDGAAFTPFNPNPRPRMPPRTIRDVLPENTRDRCRIYPSMQSSGKLQLSATEVYDFTADDLQDLGEIGRGAFGAVNKMVHRKTSKVMAVKRIRSTVDEKEQKQLLMDLEVVMKSNDCPYIVQFYGALFKEGDCWICMELMDTSLDKFYKFICERMQTRIPETIIAKITLATVKALNYLKEKLKIIHRDVKPSNILLDRRGNIKLCDFGISGKLVDSIARTRDAGCRPYMAPERIDPGRARGYDVRSDVWSLGITLMEVATGAFPYPRWGSVFEQLQQVCILYFPSAGRIDPVVAGHHADGVATGAFPTRAGAPSSNCSRYVFYTSPQPGASTRWSLGITLMEVATGAFTRAGAPSSSNCSRYVFYTSPQPERIDPVVAGHHADGGRDRRLPLPALGSVFEQLQQVCILYFLSRSASTRWSLGITLMEVATGAFPYPRWGSVFEQLQQPERIDPVVAGHHADGGRDRRLPLPALGLRLRATAAGMYSTSPQPERIDPVVAGHHADGGRDRRPTRAGAPSSSNCSRYVFYIPLSRSASTRGARALRWSLGITLMEVATGAFPYPRWGSVFEQLQQVCILCGRWASR
ncbi:protein kinase domain-containing protein [Phthorimaea operculella]|nr:protein kinase domain-containing protein [Phthorimaea operculella]